MTATWIVRTHISAKMNARNDKKHKTKSRTKKLADHNGPQIENLALNGRE